MSEAFTRELFEAIAFYVFVLFVLFMVIKVVPIRFIGEILLHYAAQIVFFVLAIGVLYFFASTEIGRAWGGARTGLFAVVSAPLILLVGGSAWVYRRRRNSAQRKCQEDHR